MTLSRAVALTVDRLVAPVEGMHRTISAGWFRAIGPLARPVRIAHDAVAGVVYGAIRLTAHAVAQGGAAATLQGSDATGVSAQAWVNGLWGDALGRHAGLAIDMTAMDVTGAPIPSADRSGAGARDGHARLVFLVHGLVETERRWSGATGDAGVARALAEAGFSPILVRYNTGRSVDANAADLARLVDRVVADWPVPVETIGIVGHSMGGLVARGACLEGAVAGSAWIERLTDLVTIGTPHGGAPLERSARAASWGLNVAPVTRPLGAFLNGRSRGIKDLGGTPPPATFPEALHHVRHRLVGGVVTSDPAHPIGSAVGDLMVRPSSSLSSRDLDTHDRLLVGGVNHFRLLDHPAITDRVVAWLQEPLTDPPAEARSGTTQRLPSRAASRSMPSSTRSRPTSKESPKS